MKQLSISEFIQKTISEIESSLPGGYAIDDSIDFEISVTTTETAGGGIDLKVISGKLTDGHEIVQKINFSIIDAVKKDKDLKKSTNTLIKSLGRGMKELAKVGEQLEKKPSQPKQLE